MPQTKQAKKALRQDTRKAEKNKLLKAELKTALKKTRKEIVKADEKSEATLRATLKQIDKAAQMRLIKKNTASRRKSRLVRSFNKAKKST
jgi:small subunit ribosomal protein S20